MRVRNQLTLVQILSLLLISHRDIFGGCYYSAEIWLDLEETFLEYLWFSSSILTTQSLAHEREHCLSVWLPGAGAQRQDRPLFPQL